LRCLPALRASFPSQLNTSSLNLTAGTDGDPSPPNDVSSLVCLPGRFPGNLHCTAIF
jgi:hypothetical protein